MAVAGLHKASMLDPYLGVNHSPASRRFGNKEKPTTRTSSIRKMWQDLESEGKSETMESEETLGDSNEIENECPQNQNQTVVQNGQEDDNKSCLQRSPSLDVPAKERVRKVFQDWGSKSYEGRTLYSSRTDNFSRGHCLGENECKRVRIVREWIELSGQQGGTCGTGLTEQATETGSQMERCGNGSVDLAVGCKSSIRRIYGRQALLDLLAKFVRERKREVDGLLANQYVSNFAHRHRIQSLLKGRFLRNQRFVEDAKQTSVAANELGLLRQTHAVSDIRKGFLSKLNNYDHAPEVVTQSNSDKDMKYAKAVEIPDNPQELASPVVESHDPEFDSETSSDNDSTEQVEEIIHEIPDEIGEEFETTNLTSNWETENFPAMVDFTESRIQNHDDSVIIHEASVSLHPLQTSTDSLNWHEVSQAEEEWHESVTEDDDSEWHQLTRTDSDEGIDVSSPARSDSQESHEEWYDNAQHETPESGMTMFRSNVLYWSDDDNNDSRFELTQLTNRRTVSNLLQSDFGPRLDQLLMRAYVERQNQASESENEDGIEAVDPHSPSVISQTQDREIIDGLRIDMDNLHQRMNDMQRMLEACMDMQHELQRFMHQELYSALNYNSGSSHGKKGVCFLCCDNGAESLPDRSAHMYICSQCTQKVNWSKVKESVRHP